jgi:hypothetical protein
MKLPKLPALPNIAEIAWSRKLVFNFQSLAIVNSGNSRLILQIIQLIKPSQENHGFGRPKFPTAASGFGIAQGVAAIYAAASQSFNRRPWPSFLNLPGI